MELIRNGGHQWDCVELRVKACLPTTSLELEKEMWHTSSERCVYKNVGSKSGIMTYCFILNIVACVSDFTSIDYVSHHVFAYGLHMTSLRLS